MTQDKGRNLLHTPLFRLFTLCFFSFPKILFQQDPSSYVLRALDEFESIGFPARPSHIGGDVCGLARLDRQRLGVEQNVAPSASRYTAVRVAVSLPVFFIQNETPLNDQLADRAFKDGSDFGFCDPSGVPFEPLPCCHGEPTGKTGTTNRTRPSTIKTSEKTKVAEILSIVSEVSTSRSYGSI